MGFWEGCQNIGNIIGLVVGGIFIQNLDLNWTYVPIVLGSNMLLNALVVKIWIIPNPDDLEMTGLNESLIISESN